MLAGALFIAAGAAFWLLRRPRPPAASPLTSAVPATAITTVPTTAPAPPALFVETQLDPTPPETALDAAVLKADADRALALARRAGQGAQLGREDVATAEDLHSRHPDQPAVRSLLGTVLMTAAQQQQSKAQLDEAERHLRRAVEVLEGNVAPRVALANLLLEKGDWIGAEAAARQVLSLDPRDDKALHALAFALFRQDRNREARQALEDALAISEDPGARALLERIAKAAGDESGMREQGIAHFHVRYDGDAHEAVGREILRILERHYAQLTVVFGHQPQVPIPVILFGQQAYYDASGAPAWSGGVYDSLDGRIRIPIGGLTTSLTADVDSTLLHEITHAFIAERTAGTCPRDIHEGLAQYMEGKRLEALLTEKERAALANGRIGGVHGFYLGALAFVEELIGSRGMGGIGDLLRVMGETRNVDRAFEQVHGQDYAATKRGWATRFQRRYGG